MLHGREMTNYRTHTHLDFLNIIMRIYSAVAGNSKLSAAILLLFILIPVLHTGMNGNGTPHRAGCCLSTNWVIDSCSLNTALCSHFLWGLESSSEDVGAGVFFPLTCRN